MVTTDAPRIMAPVTSLIVAELLAFDEALQRPTVLNRYSARPYTRAGCSPMTVTGAEPSAATTQRAHPGVCPFCREAGACTRDLYSTGINPNLDKPEPKRA